MILVTGAKGLLGGELIRRLVERGAPVRGTDLLPGGEAWPKQADYVHGDLLSPDACRRACANVSAVIHTAALQHHSGVPRWGRERFFHRNAEMTRNVAAAAAEAGARTFVMVSSDMVYGMPPGRPLRETDTPAPIGPYGRSKLASEAECTVYRSRGLNVTVLRPRLIVGPGRLGVLQKLFDRIRAGKSVPMLGNGRNRYQMVAVADVAAACLLAVDSRKDGLYNLGSSDPPPIRELLGDLCRRADSRSRPAALPLWPANTALWSLHCVRLAPLVPEQFRIASVDYVLDTSRALDDLGWRPQYSDPDMLWQAYRTYVDCESDRSAP